MELSGRLSTFSLGDLLQWAEQERRTGALVLRRSEREKRLYFDGGRLVACLSNDPGEFYGEDLLLHADLERSQLRRALLRCSETGCRLGEALTELGLMTADEVRRTLRRRIEDAVCDLFLWPRGVFYFELDEPPEEEILPEPIRVMALVMEGARRKDHYERMRRVLPHEEVVLHRGTSDPSGVLTPRQWRIFQSTDGRKTLRELYEATRGSYYKFFEDVYQLCLREVLDIAEIGEAPAPSTEIRIDDLLLEQAAQEEPELIRRRRSGLPAEVLEGLYPIWGHEPPEEERQHYTPKMLAWSARLDGTSTLGDLLSDDLDERDRQMDFLLVQLRRGHVALLAEPVVALDEEAERPRWWRRLWDGG